MVYEYKKLVRDGKVAVLFSPGYGAGWSTWSSEAREGLIFDADLITAVLDGDSTRLKELVVERYGDCYTGGANNLKVDWLNQGVVFEITEYDGYESIQIISYPDDFLIA